MAGDISIYNNVARMEASSLHHLEFRVERANDSTQLQLTEKRVFFPVSPLTSSASPSLAPLVLRF